jgi:hypothetical protein
VDEVELISASAPVPPGRWTCPGDVAADVGAAGAGSAVAGADGRVFANQADISGFMLPVWRLGLADGSVKGARSNHQITAGDHDGRLGSLPATAAS